MVVSEKAVSLQSACVEPKKQVACLQAANSSGYSTKQDQLGRLTAALTTISRLTLQNEQQLQSARANHRAVASNLATSQSNFSESIRQLRQCQDQLSEVQQQVVTANDASSKKIQAAEASASQAAGHSQKLEHELEALKAEVARHQEDAASMADAAAQREEAARVRERELQERVQRQCEVLAMAEGKHQQQSAEQGARQQEQHDASLQRVRDAAPAQGHQQRLEALQAQLDAQADAHQVQIRQLKDEMELVEKQQEQRVGELEIDLLNERGVAAVQQGKLRFALQQMQVVLKHPGADVKRRKRNHFNMGCVLDELKQPLDAIVSMSAVLALDENYHHALHYRATLYSRLGDCSRALQDLHVLKEKGVTVAQNRLAELQRRLGLSIDAYQVLGVKPHCLCQEAYAAYRRVALIHHPDKLHQDVAKAANNDGTFTLAKTALELILDPTKQRRLHMQLAYSRVCKRR